MDKRKRRASNPWLQPKIECKSNLEMQEGWRKKTKIEFHSDLHASPHRKTLKEEKNIYKIGQSAAAMWRELLLFSYSAAAKRWALRRLSVCAHFLHPSLWGRVAVLSPLHATTFECRLLGQCMVCPSPIALGPGHFGYFAPLEVPVLDLTPNSSKLTPNGTKLPEMHDMLDNSTKVGI